MYIATIFSAELGDIVTVQPAETFDDGVAFVFGEVGAKPKYEIEVGRTGRYFSLKVMEGDVTVATVEDMQPVEAASQHPHAVQIIEACNAVARGDDAAIRTLFTGCSDQLALKERVVQHCYTEGCVTKLTGFTYLAARHDTTQVGIFVLSGGFNRAVFKKAVEEAKAAGLKTSRMYVYADFCTYSGPGIQFVKLDDLGLPTESSLLRQARELVADIQANEVADRIASKM